MKCYLFYYFFLNNFKSLKKICFSNSGLAISGIQLGIFSNVFFIFKKTFFLFKNSIIVWKSLEKTISKEGCLSLKNKYYSKRCRFIYVFSHNFLNLKKIFLKDFYSICIQHEIDHCNCILLNQVQ
ncbi:peptide deformylase [Candidatus Vidania fulgoroideorum]